MTRTSLLGLLLIVGCSARHDRAAVAPSDVIAVAPDLTVACAPVSPDSFVHEPVAQPTTCRLPDAGEPQGEPQLDVDPNAPAPTRARAVEQFLLGE